MSFSNNDPRFTDWFYNPQFINPPAYRDYQAQAQEYEQQQSREVMNVAYKFKEYLDAIDNVDCNHQQDAIVACLRVIANKKHWNNQI